MMEEESKVRGQGNYLHYLRSLWVEMGTYYSGLLEFFMMYNPNEEKIIRSIRLLATKFVSKSRLVCHEFNSLKEYAKKKGKVIDNLDKKNKELWNLLCAEGYGDVKTIKKTQEIVEEIMENADKVKGEYGGILDVDIKRYGDVSTDIPNK